MASTAIAMIWPLAVPLPPPGERKNQDLVLAGRQRRQWSSEWRSTGRSRFYTGEDRGVFTRARVEVLVGIRVQSGPNTTLRVGVAVVFMVEEVDCRPNNVFARRQRQPDEVGVLRQPVCVASFIRVAARRSTWDALRTLGPRRSDWALRSLWGRSDSSSGRSRRLLAGSVDHLRHAGCRGGSRSSRGSRHCCPESPHARLQRPRHLFHRDQDDPDAILDCHQH